MGVMRGALESRPSLPKVSSVRSARLPPIFHPRASFKDLENGRPNFEYRVVRVLLHFSPSALTTMAGSSEGSPCVTHQNSL
jgi:hypothetical protein